MLFCASSYNIMYRQQRLVPMCTSAVLKSSLFKNTKVKFTPFIAIAKVDKLGDVCEDIWNIL